MIDWSKKSVLVTGGTGSFGKTFIRTMLNDHRPHRLVVFSRDELKQHEMRSAGFDGPSIRYFIGDVRDEARLRRAMQGIDVVVHAAALKQVPACEYNPIEAILTNIMGARNVVEAALDTGVERVMALSTDKAVNPVNLYGATKLAAEKLFVQSNAYAGGRSTRFSCVRYGNVVGSRGSVVPVFLRQRGGGVVTVTDERMTRFWLSLDRGVRFTFACIEQVEGGEVFVPRIPSMRVVELARALAPDSRIDYIGIRPGEKLHEVLISEDEARHTVEMDDMFVVQPAEAMWFGYAWNDRGRRLPEGFSFASNTNPRWLSGDEMRDLVGSAMGAVEA
jgi:UDP-N-acetylglucosamine 4,6-dehydratase